MNLYLDTSALVKLYIDEKGSDQVQRLSDGATRRWISILGYPEVRSAFARRHRERHLSDEAHDDLVRRLNDDWQHLDIVVLEPELAWRAGMLAKRHALRGADSVHLASALRVHGVIGQVTMVTFDDALQRAAATERLSQG